METDNLEKNIFIVRHGESYYGQTQCFLDVANDLTSKGIESSKRVAEYIRRNSYAKRLRVLSSPYGRALQTAKIIVDLFNMSPPSEFIELESKVEETRVHTNLKYLDLIKPTNRLVKSQGFRWKYVNPLIVGGQVDFEDILFNIDPQLSNPEGYDFHTYLVQDEMKKIPNEVKSNWPGEYVDFINGVETFESVSHRMMQVLAEIKHRQERDTDYLIVTHGSLMGFLAYLYSGQFIEEISTGEVITIKGSFNKYVIQNAGSLEKAGLLSSEDIFDSCNKRFGYNPHLN